MFNNEYITKEQYMLGLFSKEEYGPEDYVFTDPKTGEKYISTPEADVAGTLMVIGFICVSMPFFMGLVFWLSF